jgi:hypothetical protein
MRSLPNRMRVFPLRVVDFRSFVADMFLSKRGLRIPDRHFPRETRSFHPIVFSYILIRTNYSAIRRQRRCEQFTGTVIQMLRR